MHSFNWCSNQCLNSSSLSLFQDESHGGKTPLSSYLKEPQVSFYFLITKGEVNCCTVKNICRSQSSINYKRKMLYNQFKLGHINKSKVFVCLFVWN